MDTTFNMTSKTLDQIVAEKPFKEFDEFWPMGSNFIAFMSNAIVSEWVALPGNNGDLAPVRSFFDEYLKTVFNRDADTALVDQFAANEVPQSMKSGEFDALSYAFYRSAFIIIAQNIEQYRESLARERRLYTKRVGKIFFHQLHDHISLRLPTDLDTATHFAQLDDAIQKTGVFLKEEGYLHTHFDFSFDVKTEHAGRHIRQSKANLLADLRANGMAYALYEMGYPVILPSAVYLYHTMGEAQHHSSRTIEELFDRVGYEARETDDFDPIGYPSDMVVELWEIRKLG